MDLGKISSELVVLVLRPSLERMIVAFIAIESRGQEELSRVLSQHLRRPKYFVVRRRWIRFRGSARGDDLADELVVWRVYCDFATNPFPPRSRAFDGQKLAVDHQKIAPLIRPI